MFEKFEPDAKQVIVEAAQEARRLRHEYLGTEHVLLGLLAAPPGVGRRALETMGISLAAMRARVEDVVPAGDTSVPPPSEGFLPLTPRLKRVLVMADDERERRARQRIGSEHVLLALLREGDGVAPQLLRDEGIDLERTEREVARLTEPGPPGQ
jgi:ATP-dependent Clp protease ATP-binding subunit ClpC